jgi:hypothetical protein
MSGRSPTTRSSRLLAVVVACVGVVVVALAVTGTVLAQGGDSVASIDGHTVTRDELLFHMRRLAPTVQNELHTENAGRRGCGDRPPTRCGTIDWTTPVGDGTALERLASRALDEIQQDKIIFIVAEEHGLALPIDYEDLLAQLAAENERRATAIASGETVYGLAEFSAEEYYSHLRTEVTTALTQRLSTDAAGPLWVDDADVVRAFDADRDKWSANATTYSYSKLVVRVPDGTSADHEDRLQRRVAAAGRLADVAVRVPGATLTTDTYRGGSAGASTHNQDLQAVLGSLAPGEISAPIVGTDQITYYELDDMTVDADAALAEYADRIRQSLVEEKLQQFLQHRVSTSDIEVDAAAVDAINAEDVQQ